MQNTQEGVVPLLGELLQMYIDSLNEKEKVAYHIAKSHLGSSFSLEKSNGFIQWKQKHYPPLK